MTDRVDQRDEGAGDAGGARAAVGFQHVAIDGDRPLAERVEIDDRPQAAADQPLDFGGAAVDLADVAPFARAGAAGQHAVFGRDPAAALARPSTAAPAARRWRCTAPWCGRPESARCRRPGA